MEYKNEIIVAFKNKINLSVKIFFLFIGNNITQMLLKKKNDFESYHTLL